MGKDGRNVRSGRMILRLSTRLDFFSSYAINEVFERKRGYVILLHCVAKIRGSCKRILKAAYRVRDQLARNVKRLLSPQRINPRRVALFRGDLKESYVLKQFSR